MQGSRSFLAICVAAALPAAGCSDDDTATGSREQAESGVDAATADGDTNGGDGSAEGDDPAADVAGISVPLPPPADAVATTESSPFRIVQFTVPLDQQDATIAFYDDWTDSQPDEYQRVAAGSGGVSWQNAPEPGAEMTIIAVLAPLEGDDFVAVTFTLGPAE